MCGRDNDGFGVIKMTVGKKDETALIIGSSSFIYVGEDGQQRQYDIVVPDPQVGLAARMFPFYQIEKHETDDGVAYIGRIHCTSIDKDGLYFGQRGAVLLDKHGRPISPIFDSIDGSCSLSATLMTRTHEISYSIKPDGTIEGMDYRIPHREEREEFSGRMEIEGVGLTPLALKNAIDETMEEDRERSRQFPLADFIKHKGGNRNEKGE